MNDFLVFAMTMMALMWTVIAFFILLGILKLKKWIASAFTLVFTIKLARRRRW